MTKGVNAEDDNEQPSTRPVTPAENSKQSDGGNELVEALEWAGQVQTQVEHVDPTASSV